MKTESVLGKRPFKIGLCILELTIHVTTCEYFDFHTAIMLYFEALKNRNQYKLEELEKCG